jgi:hypothetical protein
MKPLHPALLLLAAAALAAAPAAAQAPAPPAADSVREAGTVTAASAQKPLAVPGVEATGRQSSRLIGDFYRRASHGGGRYITRADIDRRHPRATTDLFRGIPSAEVVGGSVRFRSSEGHIPTGTNAIPRSMGGEGGPGGQAARQDRGRGGDGGQAAGAALRGGDAGDPAQVSDCVPSVYVDGTRWDANAADLSSLRPDDIEGIEVYSRASTAPAQYRRLNQDCAVILVWLRERQF